MKLNKLLLVLSIIGIVFSSGYSSLIGGYLKYREYKSQMADMAKNYAEKTYGREFKIESVNFGGLQVILGAYESTGWFTSKKLYECGIGIEDVVTGVNADSNMNKSVPNIAGRYNIVRSDCGEVIVNNKQIKLIKKEFVNNYYKNVSISSGMTPGNIYGPIISENRVEKQKGSFYPTCSNDIVNSMWQKDFNLPIKQWLSKYKDCLAVDNIRINIYQQPKNAENIAKAMKFAYKLDKYLRTLTTSHKVKGIYIYITELSRKEMQKKGGRITRVRYSKEHPRGAIYNYYLMIINGGPNEAKPMTKSNIFEFVEMTNSNTEQGSTLIKETKYYQPVKEILDSKLNDK